METYLSMVPEELESLRGRGSTSALLHQSCRKGGALHLAFCKELDSKVGCQARCPPALGPSKPRPICHLTCTQITSLLQIMGVKAGKMQLAKILPKDRS